MKKKNSTTTKKSTKKKTPTPNDHRYCRMPITPARVFGPNVNPHRAQLILVNDKKWVNGTVLKYYFFDKETDGQDVYFEDGSKEWRSWKGSKSAMNVVRKAFKVWKAIGIGLEFKEIDNREEADIRIGFMRNDGSWSYLGRDIMDHGTNERTMNFGWTITNGQKGLDVALHEIGHTLGFPHEHQNPNSGIVWNEEVVYENLAAEPNRWTRKETYHNIIRKLDPDAVQASNWDPNSIMHYPFEKGLIKRPKEYAKIKLVPAPGLSDRDIAWVKHFYPPIEEDQYIEVDVSKSYLIDLKPGEQIDFIFIPKVTKYYNIQTFGDMDTVIVLFEEENGELEYRSGDDDSGAEYNAFIHYKLIKNHKYVIRLRLYYSFETGETAFMIYPKATNYYQGGRTKNPYAQIV